MFWVHASTKVRFEEAYRHIADRLELPGRHDPRVDILQLVSNWLRDETNGQWMIVLDNADDVETFFPLRKGEQDEPSGGPSASLAAYLPQSRNGSILVTSRNRDAAARLVGGHQNIKEVQVMDESQGLQLLQNKLQDAVKEEDAADLLRALDYCPLAISQAAAFINQQSRMTISEYLDKFNKAKESLLHRDRGDLGDLRQDESASNSVYATWQIPFENIRGSSSLNEAYDDSITENEAEYTAERVGAQHIVEQTDISVSDSTSTRHSSTLWTGRDNSTHPTSVSQGPGDREQEISRDISMTFYRYKDSADEESMREERNGLGSIASISDDIQSQADSSVAGLAKYRQAAVSYFVKTFTKDPELFALYRMATESIQKDKFIRNHRRLLKRLFLDLDSEGRTPSQKLALGFLKSRSRRTYVSAEIYHAFVSPDHTIGQISLMIKGEKDNLSMLDRYLKDLDTTTQSESSAIRAGNGKPYKLSLLFSHV